MRDPMQDIFDAAEAAQDALHLQSGCETALRAAIEPLLAGDVERECMVWALVESIVHFRQDATACVKQMQAASMGGAA